MVITRPLIVIKLGASHRGNFVTSQFQKGCNNGSNKVVPLLLYLCSLNFFSCIGVMISLLLKIILEIFFKNISNTKKRTRKLILITYELPHISPHTDFNDHKKNNNIKVSESLPKKNHKESKVHCGVMGNEVSKHDKNVAARI